MSWLPLPVPVMKSDELTLAVQPRNVADRVSVTVTVPSEPETDVAPIAAVPKLTASGVVMDSDPVTTVNVTAVGPVLAPAADAADAVTAAGASANAKRRSNGLRNVSPEGRADDTDEKGAGARRHPPMAPRPGPRQATEWVM